MTDSEIIQSAAQKCSKLECDGTVKVLHYVMSEHGIKHFVFQGYVDRISTKDTIPLHYWIKLPNNYIVDYKCQMWLGEDAPNGIFNAKDFPDFIYHGHLVELKVPQIIYQILTDEF